MGKTYSIGDISSDNETKGGRGSNKYAKQQIKAAKDANAYTKAFRETQKRMEKFTFDKIGKAFLKGLKKLSDEKRKLRIKNE